MKGPRYLRAPNGLKFMGCDVWIDRSWNAPALGDCELLHGSDVLIMNQKTAFHLHHGLQLMAMDRDSTFLDRKMVQRCGEFVRKLQELVAAQRDLQERAAG